MKRSKRIAFDVHGVLDTYAYMRDLAKLVYEDPSSKLIIISGQMFDTRMQNLLKKYSIKFDWYFSIAQELLDQDANLITWIDGKPWADDDVWNKAKATICERECIELLYDDSTEYGQYFTDIDTLYIQLHNGHWSESGREQLNKNCS